MSTVEIELTQGKVALVDAADLDLVARYRWHAARINGHWYAAHSELRKTGVRKIYLHRLIADVNAAPHVRPVNGDALDCRRENFGVGA